MLSWTRTGKQYWSNCEEFISRHAFAWETGKCSYNKYICVCCLVHLNRAACWEWPSALPAFHFIAGKHELSFWALLPLSTAKKVGFRVNNAIKAGLHLWRVQKRTLFVPTACWLSGQVGIFGTRRSIQKLVRVNSEVEIYVNSQYGINEKM